MKIPTDTNLLSHRSRFSSAAHTLTAGYGQRNIFRVPLIRCEEIHFRDSLSLTHNGQIYRHSLRVRMRLPERLRRRFVPTGLSTSELLSQRQRFYSSVQCLGPPLTKKSPVILSSPRPCAAWLLVDSEAILEERALSEQRTRDSINYFLELLYIPSVLTHFLSGGRRRQWTAIRISQNSFPCFRL